jgi:predicted transcriptional regulator
LVLFSCIAFAQQSQPPTPSATKSDQAKRDSKNQYAGKSESRYFEEETRFVEAVKRGDEALRRGEYLTHEQVGERLQRFLQS